MEEKEIWKDIPNYKGLYQASNYGRIKSLGRYDKFNRYIKEKILKIQIDKYGYARVSLSKNGKVKLKQVHRLVAETFILNPDNLPEVNHKDENTLNNCVKNLEFCTSKYNTNYGNRNKKISKKNSKKIIQYLENGNIVKVWNSLTEASKNLNIQVSHISSCCKGKRKKTGGYCWRFANE